MGEITMFYIDNFPAPNFNYMIILNLSFFGFLLLLYLFKKFLCKIEKTK